MSPMSWLHFETEIPSTVSCFEHLGPSWWHYLGEKTLGLWAISLKAPLRWPFAEIPLPLPILLPGCWEVSSFCIFLSPSHGAWGSWAESVKP